LRRATPERLFRGLAGPDATDEDFESFAKRRGPPVKALEGERLLSYYGVSTYTSVEALLRRRSDPFVAEIDPAQASAILVVKTLHDPQHYDVLGDRRDMLGCVIGTFPSQNDDLL